MAQIIFNRILGNIQIQSNSGLDLFEFDSMPNPNFSEVQNRFHLVAAIGPDFAKFAVIREKLQNNLSIIYELFKITFTVHLFCSN